MYGTAFSGGANNYGAVYKIVVLGAGAATPRPKSIETVLWSFTAGSDGGMPTGGLIMDRNGNLYGTTTMGGWHGGGTVFKLSAPHHGSTEWSMHTLWTFRPNRDGGSPAAGLIAGPDGTLFGTTQTGGAHAAGTVFALAPPPAGETDWTETTLWQFTGGADGGHPLASLLIDTAGNLYGTASLGGTNPLGGTVFMLTRPQGGASDWTETTLWSFTGAEGAHPASALIGDSEGRLYGTAPFGGASSYGVVYSLTPPSKGGAAWTEQTLWNFSGGAGGAYPFASLIADRHGALYGATHGFSPPDYAQVLPTIFRISPPPKHMTGWTGTTLVTLAPENGWDLLTPLIYAGSGRLLTTVMQTPQAKPGNWAVDGSILQISGTGFRN
ncbi:MAG: choice-of-anchor tandem repeat GloVer-containing protein [Rhodospirillales bacterium]